MSDLVELAEKTADLIREYHLNAVNFDPFPLEGIILAALQKVADE
jgi:hypothetical protein